MKYNIADKFILEVRAVSHEMDESLYLMDNTARNRVYEESELDRLERLDSDYINENFGELQDEAYNRGLQDAWNVFKKADEMSDEDYEKCFGLEDGYGLTDLSPQEAIAKLEAYENLKIKVGDVVFIADEPEDLGCVISVEDDGTAYVLWNDGSGGHIVRKYLRKTGRNMRAVQKLLDELKKGL